MSGIPNLPDIAELRIALVELIKIERDIESATFIRVTAEKSIREAEDRKKDMRDRVDTLLKRMDVDSPGNFGYQNRFRALLSGLAMSTEDLNKYAATQPNPNCEACKNGHSFMNRADPYPGYKHEDTSKIDWPTHNSRGHHHILWNGASNESVECGSPRCNELAQHETKGERIR